MACYFQGTIEGSAPSGDCFGQSSPVTMTGTIGEENDAVSGTLTDAAGTQIGTFSGSISEKCDGHFTVTGVSTGTWEAPALDP